MQPQVPQDQIGNQARGMPRSSRRSGITGQESSRVDGFASSRGLIMFELVAHGKNRHPLWTIQQSWNGDQYSIG